MALVWVSGAGGSTADLLVLLLVIIIIIITVIVIIIILLQQYISNLRLCWCEQRSCSHAWSKLTCKLITVGSLQKQSILFTRRILLSLTVKLVGMLPCVVWCMPNFVLGVFELVVGRALYFSCQSCLKLHKQGVISSASCGLITDRAQVDVG